MLTPLQEIKRISATLHLYSYPAPILYPSDKATAVKVGELMGEGNKAAGTALCCSIGMAPRVKMIDYMERAQFAVDEIRRYYTPDYVALSDRAIQQIIGMYEIDDIGADATLTPSKYPELWHAFNETSRRTHDTQKEATR